MANGTDKPSVLSGLTEDEAKEFHGIFVTSFLPMHYHPVLKYDQIRRGMDDTFFIVIEARDPRFNLENTKSLLEKAGGKAITELEA